MKEAELASSIFKSMNLLSGTGKKLGSKLGAGRRISGSWTSKHHLPPCRRPASASASAARFVTLQKTSVLEGGASGAQDAQPVGRMGNESGIDGQNCTAFARASSCPGNLSRSLDWRRDTPGVEGLCAKEKKDKDPANLPACLPPSVALEEVDGKSTPHLFIRNIHPYHVLFNKLVSSTLCFRFHDIS